MRPSLGISAPPTLTSLVPAGGQRGTTAEVTAAGTFDAWPVQAWASDTAVSVTAGKGKGKLSVTIGRDATPGVCWVRLFNATGASQLRPFVVGTLPEATEVEPNDTPGKPQAIDQSVVVNGKLAKGGDVDVFAVKLAKGQTLVAAVDAHHALRSPMDAVLQVTSADGTVLEQNHDHRGLDPQIAFTASKDGTYLARLYAFPSQPDSSIRHFGSEACIYRLTLSTGGVIDFVTPLAVERGKDALLTLHGWNLSEPTAKLGPADRFVFPNWSATGGSVVHEPHPCYDITKAAPESPLTPPFTVTGRVDQAKEPSRLLMKGKKGQPLAIRIEAPSIGSSLAPTVGVFDTGKKRVATAEAALNADLETTFNPPAEGPFAVEVRDQYAIGGPRAFYRLRVVPVGPTFEPTATADRFTLVPGQPLDVPIALNPKNGFAAELDWAVNGLPAGVSMKPVPPSGKPDPKSVTLRFEAKASVDFRSAIRITATPKSDPKAPRTVTAKIDGFEAVTPDLWLTVTRPAATR